MLGSVLAVINASMTIHGQLEVLIGTWGCYIQSFLFFPLSPHHNFITICTTASPPWIGTWFIDASMSEKAQKVYLLQNLLGASTHF